MSQLLWTGGCIDTGLYVGDQGPNVDGAEIRNALARYGIKKKRSSPYHPEGDGQSERGIQAVKQIMRCMLQEKEVAKDSWSTLLPQVGYIMNSMPNISTGFTPFRIMYGVDPKPLLGSVWDSDLQEQYYLVLDWVMEMEQLEGMINDEVEENLTQARSKMKKCYDKGKEETRVDVGDMILLKNQNRKNGLDQQYNGPFIVIKRKLPNIQIRLGME